MMLGARANIVCDVGQQCFWHTWVKTNARGTIVMFAGSCTASSFSEDDQMMLAKAMLAPNTTKD
jgi:hypothetical protein